METFPWWTEEQKKFEQEMNAFTKESMPRDVETRWKREFPWDIFEKIAEGGYTGAGIPIEYGGLGLGATGACIAAEALNRMPGVGRAFVGNMLGGLRQIIEYGTEEQKKRFLPRIAKLIVRSKATMQEWWHKPDETRETIVDGWVYTGDLGRYDEKGYIYIVDRKKDMIVSGGENVFPREIEEIIYRHPSVQEAAVFGIPDPYWVEKVHAVVVLKKGATLTEQELIDFCKQRLARFKAPKSVEFVDVLPKNPAGKILKREMREKYWSGMERRV